ncbi:MAG: hypothetical protein JWM91_5195 [Rhodospirillales bacterium]|nr:hypothetical protein [Rhodospirillales bacterium]
MNKSFTAKLQKSPAKGGWTSVVIPDSAAFFGTKGLVKVSGTIDGCAFESAWGTGPTKCRSRPVFGK